MTSRAPLLLLLLLMTSSALADKPKAKATKAVAIEQLRPASLYRASRLIESFNAQLAYDSCAGANRDTKLIQSAELIRDIEDLVDVLEVSYDSDVGRLNSLGRRALLRFPPPELVIAELHKSLTSARTTANELASLQPAAGAAPSGRGAETQIQALRSALNDAFTAVAAYLQQRKGGAKACDETCVRALVSTCRADLSPPAAERTPAGGGVAFAPKAVDDGAATSTPIESDQIEWMWSKLESMCKAHKEIFPRACEFTRDGALNSHMQPGILFAAALRSDLERLPARTGTAEDLALLMLLERLRAGAPPIALLAGLRLSFDGKASALGQAIAKASALIALYGDILSVIDQNELERALPTIAENVWRQLDQCSENAQGEPPCAKLTSRASNADAEQVKRTDLEQLRRLGRELFSLNQLSLRGAPAVVEPSEAGLQLMLATVRVLSIAMENVSAIDSAAWLPNALSSASMLSGRYADGILALDAVRSKREVIEVLPLLVAVASSSTPSGVSAAIASVAPRVTQGDLRAQSPQLTLSALVGPTFTWDEPLSAADGANAVVTFGLMASLGFAITSPKPLPGYIHLYFSLVDVGQLISSPIPSEPGERSTSSGIADVEATTTTNIRLAQVLRPGIALSWGIPQTSLLIGLSVSTAPDLREYEVSLRDSNAVKHEQYSVFRFGAHLAVDAPLLSFF